MFWANFWSISQFLRQNFFFSGNTALPHTTLYGFLAPCQNLEKTNNKILRKRPDRRKHGRTDRPYFIAPPPPPPTTAECPKRQI